MLKSFAFIIIVALFIFSPRYILCQKNVEVKDNHGKMNITIQEFNKKYKDYVLNVNKYIDTAKPIMIENGVGNFCGLATLNQLRLGYSPFGIVAACTVLRGGEKILWLKIVNNRLNISCSIDGFDGKYIARVIDNRLITSKSDYHLYVSDKYFELFDDYYIPVLQIQLIKDINTIYWWGF